MAVTVMCEQCFTTIQVSAKAVGKSVKCPECGQAIQVERDGSDVPDEPTKVKSPGKSQANRKPEVPLPPPRAVTLKKPKKRVERENSDAGGIRSAFQFVGQFVSEYRLFALVIIGAVAGFIAWNVNPTSRSRTQQLYQGEHGEPRTTREWLEFIRKDDQQEQQDRKSGNKKGMLDTIVRKHIARNPQEFLGPDPAAVPDLLQTLTEDSARMTFIAEAVLKKFTPSTPPFTDDVLAGMAHPHPQVQRWAKKLLRYVGPEAKQFQAELVKLLDSPDLETAGSAAHALARIGPETLPLLVAKLNAPDAKLVREVVGAIGVMQATAAAVPVLVEMLDRNDPILTDQSLDILSRIGPDALPAAERLVKLLQSDANEKSRLRAVTALTSFGAGVIPHLKKLSESPDPRHQQEAAQILSKIKAPTPEAGADVIASLKSNSDAALPDLLKAVQAMGVQGQEAIDALTERGQKQRPRSRPIADMIWKLAPDHRRLSVATLTLIAETKEADGQLKAMETLGSLGEKAKDAVTVLLDVRDAASTEVKSLREKESDWAPMQTIVFEDEFKNRTEDRWRPLNRRDIAKGDTSGFKTKEELFRYHEIRGRRPVEVSEPETVNPFTDSANATQKRLDATLAALNQIDPQAAARPLVQAAAVAAPEAPAAPANWPLVQEFQETQQPALKELRNLLDAQPKTPERLLELATWCREHELLLEAEECLRALFLQVPHHPSAVKLYAELETMLEPGVASIVPAHFSFAAPGSAFQSAEFIRDAGVTLLPEQDSQFVGFPIRLRLAGASNSQIEISAETLKAQTDVGEARFVGIPRTVQQREQLQGADNAQRADPNTYDQVWESMQMRRERARLALEFHNNQRPRAASPKTKTNPSVKRPAAARPTDKPATVPDVKFIKDRASFVESRRDIPEEVETVIMVWFALPVKSKLVSLQYRDEAPVAVLDPSDVQLKLKALPFDQTVAIPQRIAALEALSSSRMDSLGKPLAEDFGWDWFLSMSQLKEPKYLPILRSWERRLHRQQALVAPRFTTRPPEEPFKFVSLETQNLGGSKTIVHPKGSRIRETLIVGPDPFTQVKIHWAVAKDGKYAIHMRVYLPVLPSILKDGPPAHRVVPANLELTVAIPGEFDSAFSIPITSALAIPGAIWIADISENGRLIQRIVSGKSVGQIEDLTQLAPISLRLEATQPAK